MGAKFEYSQVRKRAENVERRDSVLTIADDSRMNVSFIVETMAMTIPSGVVSISIATIPCDRCGGDRDLPHTTKEKAS